MPLFENISTFCTFSISILLIICYNIDINYTKIIFFIRRAMKKDLLKVAFMYDFDETLSPNYMQEYSLLPTLNIESGKFWQACNDFAKKHNMDPILSYMYNI